MTSESAEPSVKQPPAGPRAEAKRQAIVKAARELFLRDGFDVSVELIAAEAGVSKVTVYNHFGNKEALFIGVVKDALDAPLGDTLVAAIDRLADSDDLREALTAAARAWVDGTRANPDVLALRNVVARELHRFPELGTVWHGVGADRHHPAAAGALRQLDAKGRLDVPDIEVAIIQLYSLLLYPHLVFSAYGTSVDDSLTERLITSGVDMFLSYYAPKGVLPR
ncbi:TetR/AcrR family transcriptional regulator [Streptomyces sp. NPDC000345]|uniref:TetR/AcrR family transcriptional regulator n=1 Tax=Streptomyces sp. NPDC000345 TaxID=3364537 RepID=UPI003691BCCE